MKQILFITSLFLAITAFSQSKTIQYDSLRMKTNYNICAIVRDSLSNAQFYNELNNIDTNQILSGLSLYYKDLGFCQYKSYAYTSDTNYLSHAIQNTEYAYHLDSNDYSLIWDLGMFYFFKGDCNKSLNYFEILRQHKHLNKSEKKQIKSIKKSSKCKIG